MPLRSWVDGQPTDWLALVDRGLHYGDGLFETIAVHHGRPCLWPEHWRRLERGAERLGLTLPDRGCLHRECLDIAAGISMGVIKLILTRGNGARGYRPPKAAQARRITTLYARSIPRSDWLTEGVHVRLCQTPACHSPALAGLKHLGRLEQVLAQAEWDDPNIAEGLMTDTDGRLIGGTMTNLFLLRGDRLVTPCLADAGVLGTVRAVICRLAPRLGYEVMEAEVRYQDLLDAEAAFLTNALIGLWPIRACAGRDLGYRELPGRLIEAIRAAAFDPAWERV